MKSRGNFLKPRQPKSEPKAPKKAQEKTQDRSPNKSLQEFARSAIGEEAVRRREALEKRQRESDRLEEEAIAMMMYGPGYRSRSSETRAPVEETKVEPEPEMIVLEGTNDEDDQPITRAERRAGRRLKVA